MRRSLLLCLAMSLPVSATAQFVIVYPPPNFNLVLTPLPAALPSTYVLGAGGAYGGLSDVTLLGTNVLTLSYSQGSEAVLQAPRLTNAGTLDVQGTLELTAPSPHLDSSGTLTLSGVVNLNAGKGTIDSTGLLEIDGQATVYGGLTSFGDCALGLTRPPAPVPPRRPGDLQTALEGTFAVGTPSVYASGDIYLKQLNVTNDLPASETLTGKKYLLAVSDSSIQIDTFSLPTAGFLVMGEFQKMDPVTGAAVPSGEQVAYLQAVTATSGQLDLSAGFDFAPKATYRTQQAVVTGDVNLSGTVIQAAGFSSGGEVSLGLTRPPIGPPRHDPDVQAAVAALEETYGIGRGSAYIAATGAISMKSVTITVADDLMVDGAKILVALSTTGEPAVNSVAIPPQTVFVDPAFTVGDRTIHAAYLLVDMLPPVLTVPASVTGEATSAAGAEVTYAASATDGVDGAVTPACSPGSGSTFPLGTTWVTCGANDGAGNVATTATFTVTVSDTTAPALPRPEAITRSATSAAGAVVSYVAPVGADLVDGPIAASCSPASGSTFPPGTTTVRCTATDRAGNEATASFDVNVHFTMSGFFAPIDSGNTLNTVKGGSTVPVKFRVQGDVGVEIADTAAIASATTRAVACPTTPSSEDLVEYTVNADASLRYDAVARQFVWNWKTPKLPGACVLLTVTLTDGSSRSAQFKLK